MLHRFIVSLLAAIVRALAIHGSSQTLEGLADRVGLGVPRLVILILTVIAIELVLELAAVLRRRRRSGSGKR